MNNDTFETQNEGVASNDIINLDFGDIETSTDAEETNQSEATPDVTQEASDVPEENTKETPEEDTPSDEDLAQKINENPERTDEDAKPEERQEVASEIDEMTNDYYKAFFNAEPTPEEKVAFLKDMTQTYDYVNRLYSGDPEVIEDFKKTDLFQGIVASAIMDLNERANQTQQIDLEDDSEWEYVPSNIQDKYLQQKKIYLEQQKKLDTLQKQLQEINRNKYTGALQQKESRVINDVEAFFVNDGYTNDEIKQIIAGTRNDPALSTILEQVVKPTYLNPASTAREKQDVLRKYKEYAEVSFKNIADTKKQRQEEQAKLRVKNAMETKAQEQNAKVSQVAKTANVLKSNTLAGVSSPVNIIGWD